MGHVAEFTESFLDGFYIVVIPSTGFTSLQESREHDFFRSRDKEDESRSADLFDQLVKEDGPREASKLTDSSNLIA